MHKVLIDINVILDVALERKQYVGSSQKVLTAVANKTIKGYLSAFSVPILYYLISKASNRKNAQDFVRNVIKLFAIVDGSDAILKKALALSLKDYEDGLQAASAEQCGAEYIVTRNVKDFRLSPVKALTPEEYLDELTNG